MTLGNPWGLLLLAAAPVIVWLHRRRAPQVVRVASVEPYRAAAGGPQPSREARGVDKTLVLLVAAVVALACAAAEPTLPGGAPVVTLRIDRSMSMDARTVAGPTVSESAVARARALVAAAIPGATIVETDLAPTGETATRGVVVSDRRDASDPDAVVVGPSTPARPNVGLVGATLVDGRELGVAVRNYSDRPVETVVRGGSAAPVRVEAGPRATVEVRLAAPPRGGSVDVALDGADGLAADDRLSVSRRGGAATVRTRGLGGMEGASVRAALRAIGVDCVDDTAPEGSGTPARPDALVVLGGAALSGPDREGPSVQFAPAVSDATEAQPAGAVAARVVSGPRSVLGSAVTARGSARGGVSLPAPAARLVSTGRIVGGEPIWEDAAGALVVRDGRCVLVALDPSGPDSDWAREGSFPALLAAALDLVTDGPDRVVAPPGVPEGEGDVATAVLPDPDPESIRRAADVPHGIPLGWMFAALGAAAAAAAAFVGSRAPRPA